MSITNKMLNKIDDDITILKHSLHPENIDYWYKKIIEETIEIVPPWLVDKINVKQDPILPMKFNLDISKRAVRYFMMSVEQNIPKMPYSTQMYFLKVQDIMTLEMNKFLV